MAFDFLEYYKLYSGSSHVSHVTLYTQCGIISLTVSSIYMCIYSWYYCCFLCLKQKRGVDRHLGSALGLLPCVLSHKNINWLAFAVILTEGPIAQT